jgi:hypothetical protein
MLRNDPAVRFRSTGNLGTKSMDDAGELHGSL